MSLPPPAGRARRPVARVLRRILGSAAGLVGLAVLALAALGGYFLTLRFEHPVTGLVLSVTTQVPASDPEGERHADYVYGERLGESRSRRAGSGLGSTQRRGSLRPTFLELRDAQGEAIARAYEVPADEGPAWPDAGSRRSLRALRVEVGDGDGGLLHRLTRVAFEPVGGTELDEDLYAVAPKGLVRVRRLVVKKALLGLLGAWAQGGTRLLGYPEGREARLVLDTREDGAVDLLPQGAALSFLEPAPGLFTRMFGTESAALRFRFGVSVSLDPIPWTAAAGGYRIRDGAGDLAAIEIEDFLLRFRGQVLYRYLVDLDGDGRLERESETIESVLVSRRPAASQDRVSVEISFLAGPARVEDLEAVRLGDVIEAFLPDACLKGFGRDSDLGLVEQARDDALALLEPTPFTVGAALSPVDVLRSPQSWASLARAARRPYAEALAAALGERLPDPRFASREDLLALGSSPPLAPQAPGPEEAALASPTAPPLAVAAGANGLPPMDEPEARLLAHAEALLREVGRAAWPGFGEALPAVLLVGSDVEWLLRHAHPPAGFEPQGEYPGLDAPVFVRKRTYDPAFQAAFPVDGVPTVVIGTTSGTRLEPARWALTYIHEAFHVFQMQNGEFERTARLAHLAHGDATGMWQINYAFPYADPAAGQALALFGTALDRGAGVLAGALASGSPATGTEEAVRAAAGAAQALAALIPAEDVDFLRFVEWKEGVARHVELRAAHLAAAGGLVPPAPSTAAPYSDAAKEIDAGIREGLRGLGPGRVRRESFYATGAALARLLEARAPGWADRYFDPSVTLEMLLAETLKPPAAEGESHRLPETVTGAAGSVPPQAGRPAGKSPLRRILDPTPAGGASPSKSPGGA